MPFGQFWGKMSALTAPVVGIHLKTGFAVQTLTGDEDKIFLPD